MAALVLLVTLVAGPEAPQQNERVESLGAIRTPDAMEAVDAEPVADAEFGSSAAVGGTEHGSYSFRNGDRFTVLTWDEITPKPDDVSDIVKPVMRDYLSPSRVVELKADEGTVVAPDHHPRRGQLRENVVLTLYESVNGEPVDFEGVRDIQVRVFLDEATFDVELGQVDSVGPVRLTGPTVDFKGHGLSLNYNQLRQRLERLEIARGDWLRFKATQARPTPTPTHEPTPAPEPAPAEPGAPASADASVDAPTDTPDAAAAPASDPDPDPADPPQYYRARFLNGVKVVAGDPDSDDHITMLGDTLIATFGFAKDEDAPAKAAPEPTPADAPSAAPASTGSPATASASAPAGGAQPPAHAPAEPSAAPAPAIPTPADSLMVYSPDDVVITWSGRLVVQPEPDAADELAGPDDLLLAIEGVDKPVDVVTAAGDTLTAARADYLISARRLRAEGSDEAPLRIESPEMGALAGARLVLNQSTHTGLVRGPGYLKARIDRKSVV